MTSSSKFSNVPGMNKELHEGVVAAFDALSHWRDEIEVVNERCMGEVLDRTAAVTRSMGWPDPAIRATREYLENTSKVQTELIDQIIEGWKRQLKSPTAPMAIPRSLTGRIPRLPAATFARAMPEFNPLAPWTFWLQAAEMWQRAWMPDVSPQKDIRSH